MAPLCSLPGGAASVGFDDVATLHLKMRYTQLSMFATPKACLQTLNATHYIGD